MSYGDSWGDQGSPKSRASTRSEGNRAGLVGPNLPGAKGRTATSNQEYPP